MDDLSMSLNFQEESDYEGSNSHRSSPRPPPTPRYGKSPNLFSTTSVGKLSNCNFLMIGNIAYISK